MFDSTSTTALLASVLLLLSMLWMRRRQNHTSRARADDALDTVQAWPPQAVRVLTQRERQAYDTLRRALPSHLILAQVPLSRFISVPTRHSYGEWMNRAGRHSVDLLVCDEHSRVIAAIDIRPPEESPRAKKRHERLANVLQTAGVAVHVWDEGTLPSVAQARESLGIAPPEATAVDAAGRELLPMPEIQELLAAGDVTDYGQLDPVSSGFFDDLEAAAPHSRAAA
jgi:hypothetical protein